MTARLMRVVVLGAMLSAGAALAQAPGTPGAGGTGSSGTGTTGTGTGSSTGGATSSGGGLTFDPVAAAAARLFGSYRVPGSAPVDATGVYRVDTGSSPPAAGSGGSSAGSTSSTATTNTTTSGTASSGSSSP